MIIFLGSFLFIAAWLFPFLGTAPNNLLLETGDYPALNLYRFLLAIPRHMDIIELRGSIFATAVEWVAFLFSTACILTALATGLSALIFSIKNQHKAALWFSFIATLISLAYLLLCLEFTETPLLWYRAFGIGYILFLCGNIMLLIGNQFALKKHANDINGGEQAFEEIQSPYITDSPNITPELERDQSPYAADSPNITPALGRYQYPPLITDPFYSKLKPTTSGRYHYPYIADHKIRKAISDLNHYLNYCDTMLDIQQLQFINVKILALTEKYLDKVSNKRIYSIYVESKSFWENLTHDWERLDNLRDTAWLLHKEHFTYHLDSIDEIVLRLLITTTYYDTEKWSTEDTIEFVESLIEQAENLGG